jgi:DNA polymerase III epsilon subunit-like protein
MTKIFFDCEFTGLHQNTTLISIGLVSECGKSFYAEFNDFNKVQCDTWIKENVISKLSMYSGHNKGYEVDSEMPKIVKICGDTEAIKRFLETWLSQFESIEMWSDCLSYDWVLFCQIWGHAFNIPKNIYYIPFDICTLFKMQGIDPDISREGFVGYSKVRDLQLVEIRTNIVKDYGEQKHNALFDAKIIKLCYEKLSTKSN